MFTFYAASIKYVSVTVFVPIKTQFPFFFNIVPLLSAITEIFELKEVHFQRKVPTAHCLSTLSCQHLSFKPQSTGANKEYCLESWLEDPMRKVTYKL